MHCPFCAHEETKVIDSRLAGDGRQIRRRRQCLACNERFTTFESAELVMPRLIKNDNSRQPFDEAKLRYSMVRALEKRPVPSDELEQAVGRLIHKLRTMGEREVPSRLVGELVMEELRPDQLRRSSGAGDRAPAEDDHCRFFGVLAGRELGAIPRDR